MITDHSARASWILRPSGHNIFLRSPWAVKFLTSLDRKIHDALAEWSVITHERFLDHLCLGIRIILQLNRELILCIQGLQGYQQACTAVCLQVSIWVTGYNFICLNKKWTRPKSSKTTTCQNSSISYWYICGKLLILAYFGTIWKHLRQYCKNGLNAPSIYS